MVQLNGMRRVQNSSDWALLTSDILRIPVGRSFVSSLPNILPPDEWQDTTSELEVLASLVNQLGHSKMHILSDEEKSMARCGVVRGP
jgi:hypothetical protein